jgi:hypothetical protein
MAVVGMCGDVREMRGVVPPGAEHAFAVFPVLGVLEDTPIQNNLLDIQVRPVSQEELQFDPYMGT